MSLQNRVDPFGNIHAVAARGMFTGNRGVIHDPATRTLLKKRWTTKAWIICARAYKDRPPRDVMGYNGRKGGASWTELFFLDEVTALAAGHRPCFTCRRHVAKAYAAAFGDAFGMTKPTVQMMDVRLHAERLASGGRRRTSSSSSSQKSALPVGAMITDGSNAYALAKSGALPWSFEGYGAPIKLSALDREKLQVLTPAATVEVLKQGYAPVWHPSAGDASERA
ncbi:MAG: hypothetical protein NTV73_18345 [Hyphomicrobiales bacterium]|nr:hypothetical protein [Hyphomicrobiales bacterium]